MANNRGDAMDENMYIEMMRELKEVDIQLYNNIVTAAILQGTYQSSVSIRNIIPVEDFSARIAPIINKLANTEDVKAFSKGAFQRNNWKDETVVPTLERLTFNPTETIVGEQVDKWGDHVADIYQYISPMFPDQVLNTRSVERKILKLHPNYYRIAIDNDFIKVPRVITSTKDNQKVDMITGQTITDQSYKDRKAKNDLSLYDYFGYEKVRDELGNPLVTENGEYIYKLINLYGDGQYASEYHLDGQPSPIDNGTIKIDNEIPNKDLFQYFAPKTEETVVPSQPVQQAEVVSEEKAGAPEVIYKDEAKRIRVEYPNEIKVEVTGDTFKTSKLLEIQKVFTGEDDGTIVDQRKFDEEYQDWLGGYGMTDAEYQYALKNQEVLRDLLYIADNELLDNEGDALEFDTFEDVINELLKRNETLVDTAQGKLFTEFNTTDEFTEDQKNTIVSNFGTKHKMNVEKAREYINQAMAKNR